MTRAIRLVPCLSDLNKFLVTYDTFNFGSVKTSSTEVGCRLVVTTILDGLLYRNPGFKAGPNLAEVETPQEDIM
jgi:hypothetical protein